MVEQRIGNYIKGWYATGVEAILSSLELLPEILANVVKGCTHESAPFPVKIKIMEAPFSIEMHKRVTDSNPISVKI